MSSPSLHTLLKRDFDTDLQPGAGPGKGGINAPLPNFAIQLMRDYHVKKATIFLKTLDFFLCWKFLKYGEFLIQHIHLALLVKFG